MAEPDIELDERPRPSVDSLRRDIADAIAAAKHIYYKPQSAPSTIGTAKSAGSLLGASYIDVDSIVSGPGMAERYAARIRELRHTFSARSAKKWPQRLAPLLKTAVTPISSTVRWWRKRRMLPPTKNGRQIEVSMRNPTTQVDERTGKSYCPNKVTSAIYTPYDFFPRQVVVQFSKLANLYFLFVSILQMIPTWSTTGNYTTIVPLLVFVLISMTREGVEDWTRSRNDKEENNRMVFVADTSSGKKKPRLYKWRKPGHKAVPSSSSGAALPQTQTKSSKFTFGRKLPRFGAGKSSKVVGVSNVERVGDDTDAQTVDTTDMNTVDTNLELNTMDTSMYPNTVNTTDTNTFASMTMDSVDELGGIEEEDEDEDEDGKVEYISKKWQDLEVGDVVRVMQNEWIPADLVLLHSSGTRGQCFIETLALDGETTLKTREVPTEIQEHFRVENRAHARALCTVEDPNLDLFNFEGNFTFPGAPPVALTNDNILYRGSALRNTASVLGVVVFTGKETKMQLNSSKNTRTKTPKLQGKVNKTVILLAAFVLLLSGFSTLAAQRIQKNQSSHYWYLDGAEVTQIQSMMGFIIMFNTLIPLSLYVSMEICKLIQRYFMQNDIDMYDSVNDVRCRVQTASLNEELGQVSYVFSDKTGTLTDNIMLFRKVSIYGFAWIHDLDLYFDDNNQTRTGVDGGTGSRHSESAATAYLFHKVRPEPVDLNADELHILEGLARLPRKSFGGRISNAARTSTTNPILAQLHVPPQHRPSLSKSARKSLARATEDPDAWDKSRPSVHFGPSEGFSEGFSDSVTSLEPTNPWHGDDVLPMPPTRPSMSSQFTQQSVQFKEPSRPSFAPSNAPSTAPSFAASNRPSQAASMLSNGPRTSNASNWHSTANPNKEEHTPSTLSLLEYIQAHPSSPYSERAKFFLLALALCHTASPDVDLNNGETGTEIEQLDYQAASPDELALVSAARDLGFMLIDRQLDRITLRTYPNGLDSPPVDENYRVLDVIPFNSTRKRMSVIIEMPDKRIFLLTKGADNVIIERLKKSLLALADEKKELIHKSTQVRKSAEAELARQQRDVNNQRQSLESILQRTSIDHAIQESGRRSTQQGYARQSMNSLRPARSNASLQPQPVPRVSTNTPRMTSPQPPPPRGSTASVHPRPSTTSAASGRSGRSGPSRGELMELSEAQALVQTLEQIDEFSTDGLRTLMYGHRQLTANEYASWKQEYDEAKTALTDRQKRIDEVGERLEHDLSVTGATGIEDKLQCGVPEAIEKLRRANIHLWMLTGDKRETAVNIGYSCRLIKDYSTVIMLSVDDDIEAKILASLEEMDSNNIAHTVVVIDGQTLTAVEADPVLMSLFVDLGLRADSVILCRASPVQKANIVASVRAREPTKTMLAIGDGANDIAMIQAADVGIGIAGREGLQAARSSDFSIGQFRFLLKLLLVHGRWNYVRTCEYILATFYKEFFFYLCQMVFQRNCLFTGTSVFESWSISMYNTFFTSLCVISLGTMTQDLGQTVLVAVPELYQLGQANKSFNMRLLFKALVVASLQTCMCSFLAYQFYGYDFMVKDNSLYPLGVTIYASVVSIVNFKIHFITMVHYISAISILSVLISCGGYLLWNVLIGLVYMTNHGKVYYVAREFWNLLGVELVFWATVFLCLVIGYLFELVIQLFSNVFFPSDTYEYQQLEADPYIMQRLEAETSLELQQGWDYQDQLDHSWFAFFRDHWPGQPRITQKLRPEEVLRRRKRDYFAEKLGIKRKPEDYDREIQEILDRRQRELDAEANAKVL